MRFTDAAEAAYKSTQLSGLVTCPQVGGSNTSTYTMRNIWE